METVYLSKGLAILVSVDRGVVALQRGRCLLTQLVSGLGVWDTLNHSSLITYD